MVTSVVGHIYGLTFEDGRTRDNATLFHAKVKKNIEDSTKKLRIVEHLQVGLFRRSSSVSCRCLLDVPCQQRARLVSSAMAHVLPAMGPDKS